GWSGGRQLLVDLEGHGRHDELFAELDLTRTVGWFTNVYPVWLDLAGKADPGAALKHVKEELRRVPNRGLGYGVLRYMKEDLRAIPTAQIRFNYHGQLDNVLPPDSIFTLSHGSTGAERGAQQRRPYLLDIVALVSDGRLQLTVSYSDRIYQSATIEKFADLIVASLRSIIDHCQSLESARFSPSDFPLANLNQQQLDRILSRAIGGIESK
ncbi:MAG TPA: condensation domain-containing protein, partial [Pyrinomonadaceae bacterium]